MYYLDDIPQVLDGSITHSIDRDQNVATGKKMKRLISVINKLLAKSNS